mmetsp:Transcript_155/g.452  ORF Transcript_155/g.452 Transcript_155/m.452 type:complete len:245 (+) Transcript_155:709-1443(+)
MHLRGRLRHPLDPALAAPEDRQRLLVDPQLRLVAARLQVALLGVAVLLQHGGLQVPRDILLHREIGLQGVDILADGVNGHHGLNVLLVQELVRAFQCSARVGEQPPPLNAAPQRRCLGLLGHDGLLPQAVGSILLLGLIPHRVKLFGHGVHHGSQPCDFLRQVVVLPEGRLMLVHEALHRVHVIDLVQDVLGDAQGGVLHAMEVACDLPDDRAVPLEPVVDPLRKLRDGRGHELLGQELHPRAA